ncbi:MAG: respiratory nitrate reductase subunit gamma [Thermoactinomyces sp.]
MFDQFLWGYLPYIVFTIFIGGHIYRYQHDQFGWTSKSSEFLEKKHLRTGSLMFHWGILFVLGGHVMGILIPVDVYTSMGISEEFYHKMAIGFGVPAGIVATIGLGILLYRRVSIKRILATSTKSDILVLVFFAMIMLSGLSSTFLNIDNHRFDYRTTIGPWFRSIFLFNANPNYMADVPIWFKIHIVSAYGIFILWPFTRLVHVFSLPLRYLQRSFVVYRRRMPKEHH